MFSGNLVIPNMAGNPVSWSTPSFTYRNEAY